MLKDQTRNLNPHAEALLYSWMNGDEYSKQHGGTMDFWDRASDFDKKHMKELLDRLLSTRRCKGKHKTKN